MIIEKMLERNVRKRKINCKNLVNITKRNKKEETLHKLAARITAIERLNILLVLKELN